jgi:predicted MFS family arabinose efflux permease
VTASTTPSTPDASSGVTSLRRARVCTLALFALLGLLTGAWGAHVPSVKARYALDEGQLALALFALAAGAVASLFLAGRVIGWIGPRRTSLLTGLTMAALLGGVLSWPSLPMLLAVLVLLGMALSVHDVAINADGTALERLSGRALMGQLHGMFSVGAMAGAVSVAGMLRLGWSPDAQLAGLAAAVVLGLFGATSGMLDARTAPAGRGGAARFVWPRGVLLLIGLLILAGMLAEGAMYDWSVLYLQQVVGLPQDRAALGYAAFGGGMAAGRFASDGMRARLPDGLLLRGGAVLAAAGMAIALVLPFQTPAIVGFALMGAGLAPVVPLLYAAASRAPGSTSAAAIAAASSIGYSGMLIGPPLIGVIAHLSSLAMALWVVVAALALLAAAAGSVDAQEKTPTRPDRP